jgi:serine/threonine protein kinase
VVKWLHQILLGLSSLHEKGVCHTGLSTCNVFVDANDNAKISDCANILLPDETPETVLTRSPEQWKKAPPDKPADVWALGCILYQLCMTEVSQLATMPSLPSPATESSKSENGYETRRWCRIRLRTSTARNCDT